MFLLCCFGVCLVVLEFIRFIIFWGLERMFKFFRMYFEFWELCLGKVFGFFFRVL